MTEYDFQMGSELLRGKRPVYDVVPNLRTILKRETGKNWGDLLEGPSDNQKLSNHGVDLVNKTTAYTTI